MRAARAVLKRLQCIALSLLLGSGWWLWESRGSASASKTVTPGREVMCVYIAQVRRLPQGAQVVHVWAPLAETGLEQRILNRDIRSPAPYAIAKDPDYGNDILHVTLKSPVPEHVEIAVEYRARLFSADTDLQHPTPTPDELHHDLQPSGLVIIDDDVRDRARQATSGRLTQVEQARGIYEYVRRVMSYDKTTQGWGRGDTRRACLLGRGNCTDFHSLFISMARSERIPARFKIGVVIPQEPSGIVPGYHCWAEFYVEGRGWVPVDASEAWKHPEKADYYFGAHDPNRFLMSVGRDIQMVPKQQGGPVNIFFSPYVEVDGQAFSDVGVEVRFEDLQQGRAI